MNQRVLVLRTPSGISGDMLVTGLAQMAQADDAALEELVDALNVPTLRGAFSIHAHHVNAIAGWRARVTLPHQHAHRRFSDIAALFARSRLTPTAKVRALEVFRLLARVEGEVHGVAAEDVTFHEVGALDSILDVGLAAALFDRLAPSLFACSPLPLCDGVVHCAHGRLATPTPAVLRMLEGVPVYGIATMGETVTPTALAILKSFGAEFGGWPALRIQTTALVYGGRELPAVPNGALFAFGETDAPLLRELSFYPLAESQPKPLLSEEPPAVVRLRAAGS